jgi:glycosyltransferase involved in cell wall biosynthesis
MHALFTHGIAGSERYCIDLANSQARHGHDVHVCGLQNSEMKIELDSDVKYHMVTDTIFRSLSISYLARQLRIDIFHGHLREGCKAALLLPSYVGKVSTLHLGYKPRHHRRMDGLICINPSQAAALKESGHTFKFIPNWLPRVSPNVEERPELRLELNISPTTFVIGTVARFVESKGIDLLIEGFESNIFGNAALVLIGSGSEEPALRRLAKADRRIHFCGYRSDVRKILTEFDLFVSCSREEPFGLAILEAMHAGLPIVATNTEGARLLLADQPAHLVAVNDARALGEEIGKVMKERQANSTNSPVYELSQFTQEKNVLAAIDFYTEILSKVRTNLGNLKSTNISDGV